MTLGHRIVVMNNGVIQQVASPEELYAHPKNAFVAQFIGSPAMNLVSGRVVSVDGRIRFTATPDDELGEPELSIELPDNLHNSLGPITDNEVILGVRPEDIHIAGDTVAAGSVRTSVDVLAVEMLGPQRLVYFYAGKTMMVASIDPNHRVDATDRIDIVWDADKTSFFDAETEERLDLQQAGVA